MIELKATPRAERGKKLKTLREEGVLPAVVYSGKVESQAISVSEKDFVKILRDSGETALVTLKGLDAEHEVLIHDISVDVIKGNPTHVDFYVIERGKEIEVTVPLEFVGEAPVEKSGAQVVKVLHEVSIKTTPGNIPAHIEVDVSVLAELSDRIQINNLVVAEGVTILNGADDAVAIVQEKVEEVEEEVVSVDMDAVEVEKKGKEEGDEGDEKDSGEEEKKSDES